MSNQTQAEWLAEHRHGIGGSDAAAVLNLSPWATPYDVWCAKVGEAAPPGPSREMTWIGVALEDAMRKEYALRAGQPILMPTLMRHSEIPWLIGTPDGRGMEDGRIVEIKTARHGAGWGEPGTDEIPLHYLVQVHHYLMLCPEAPFADVAVLIAGADFRIYRVERDASVEADLLAREAAFWRLVRERTPPPVTRLSDAVRRWGRLSRPGAVVADQAAAEAIERLRERRDSLKEAEDAQDADKALVMAALGDAGDTLVDDGGNVLATWKLNKGRKAYTVEAKEPFRQFFLPLKG